MQGGGRRRRKAIPHPVDPAVSQLWLGLEQEQEAGGRLCSGQPARWVLVMEPSEDAIQGFPLLWQCQGAGKPGLGWEVENIGMRNIQAVEQERLFPAEAAPPPFPTDRKSVV